MKDVLFKGIGSTCEHSSRAQFRKLVVFLLNHHIFFGKLRFNAAESSTDKIVFNELTEHFVLDGMLYSVRMIAVDEAGHC